MPSGVLGWPACAGVVAATHVPTLPPACPSDFSTSFGAELLEECTRSIASGRFVRCVSGLFLLPDCVCVCGRVRTCLPLNRCLPCVTLQHQQPPR